MSKALECGCVPGYYWCAQHDIYTIQGVDRRTPEERAYDAEMERRRSGFWDSFGEPGADSCTCFSCPPCSFCEGQSDEEEDAEALSKGGSEDGK